MAIAGGLFVESDVIPATLTGLTNIMRHPGISLRALVGCLLAVLGTGLSAQESLPFARVEILNTTTQVGRTIADVVIPLPRGGLKVVPMLVTGRQEICEVRAMGARWPDGSLRYLRVDLPLEVKAGERRQVKLFHHTGPAPMFRQHAAVTQALPGMRLWFRAANQRVQFGAPELIDNGSRVRVYRSGVRCKGSCMWAELHLLVMHDTPSIRFYLQWGNSNPLRPDLHEDPGEVALEVKGTRLLLDERDSKLRAQYYRTDGVTGLLLHAGGWLADGQAQCLEGRMLTAGGAPRVRALAHGWAPSGAFGPFGELIPEVGVSPSWWKSRIARDDKAQARHPFAAPVHGCHPDPSDGGDQPDFGTIVMRPDVLIGDPSRLRSIVRSVYQEWCRPTHFRELDLRPVTSANHPRLVTLSGRPHWRAGPKIDRLGKPAKYLDNKKVAADERGNTYRGHDNEHLSINYLCALALTTGDRLALLECEHHAEMWLTEFTLNSGTANDKPGPARAIGRSLLAGSWLWLVTGRSDLAVRIVQRTKNVVPVYLKRRVGNPSLLPFVLKPRWDSKRGHYWPPWEESIAAIGFAAVYTLLGGVEAYAMAQLVSDNIVMHGVGIAPGGWRVGYKIPFASETGQPYFALLDPNFVTQQAAGSGLTQWTVPAMVLAARYSNDKLARQVGLRIFLDLISDRRFVSHRLLEWIAVVPRHLDR